MSERLGRQFIARGEAVIHVNQSEVINIEHDKDFAYDITAVQFKLTALAEGAVTDPQPTILDRLVKVQVEDVAVGHSIGEPLLEAVDYAGTYIWSLPQPLRLVRTAALKFQVAGRSTFDITYEGQRRRINAIRVEIVLEGTLSPNA